MLCTFAHGNLRTIIVLENKGVPQVTKPVSGNREMAKDFLKNYQRYTEDSFYGGLGSMLDTVSFDTNQTIALGNVKLEATATEDTATFRWTYIFNGIEAPSKCIALGYKNGFLRYFIDNWDLYTIGNTSVNLSENDAVNMAMDSASSFFWKTIWQ